jgi:hypothetical protein
MPKPKRSISEPEKKFVAARQEWKCSSCGRLLEATYQVDHTVALMNGGEDSTSNMTAMCVSCHCRKTQNEHIERAQNLRQISRDGDPLREDVVVKDGRMIRCSVCGDERHVHSPWESHHCRGPRIDRFDLSFFRYVPN